MEIVLKPPIIIPICSTIFFLLIILAVIFSKKAKWDKYLSVALVSVVFLGISFLLMQKTTIDINESGLKMSGAFTGSFNNFLSWNDINSTTLLKNYTRTEYEPILRKWGSGLPGYSVGRFQLANKMTANCIQKGSTADALFIDTSKGLYLFSFENIEDVYDEILKHTKLLSM